jgi:uncharacterized protein (DUF2267 family)
MSIDEADIVERLSLRARFASLDEARCALDATLRALMTLLTDDEAAWLSADLGPLLTPRPHPGPPSEERIADPSAEALYARVALQANLRRSVAEELTNVVCSELAESLPWPTVQRLRKHLPALAPLFELREPLEPVAAPDRLREEPGTDHTLAGGRAGGSRPLHDATPLDSEGAEPSSSRAHSQSVAATGTPHVDTQLSSARGLTQEREHRSLATARPRRDH